MTFSNTYGIIKKEIKKVTSGEYNVFSIFNISKLQRYMIYLKTRQKFGYHKWSDNNEFKNKRYNSYEDYLEHQKQKVKYFRDTQNTLNEKFEKCLINRLKKLTFLRNSNVLCLGARLGEEVKAFRNVGCFAVGIDLNPGLNNQYVMYGDFHNILFSDKSVDVIYTNSLDHLFNIDKMFNEINRILKSKGYIIIEFYDASKSKKLGYYESFYWNNTESLIKEIRKHGFIIMQNKSINYPIMSRQLVFKKK